MEALTSRLNWYLEELVLGEAGKPKSPKKNPQSKVRTNNKLNLHGRDSTRIKPGGQLFQKFFPSLLLQRLGRSFPLHFSTLLFF